MAMKLSHSCIWCPERKPCVSVWKYRGFYLKSVHLASSQITQVSASLLSDCWRWAETFQLLSVYSTVLLNYIHLSLFWNPSEGRLHQHSSEHVKKTIRWLFYPFSRLTLVVNTNPELQGKLLRSDKNTGNTFYCLGVKTNIGIVVPIHAFPSCVLPARLAGADWSENKCTGIQAHQSLNGHNVCFQSEKHMGTHLKWELLRRLRGFSLFTFLPPTCFLYV